MYNNTKRQRTQSGGGGLLGTLLGTGGSYASRPYKRPRYSNSRSLANPKPTPAQALNKPEKKNVDIALIRDGGAGAFQPLNTGPMFTNPGLLNGTTIGPAAQGQRLGRKILMKSFFLRWTVSFPANVEPQGGSPIRCLVVYDRQSNAAPPLITDVLTVDNFNSPMNLNNSERFIIVADFLTPPISRESEYSVSGTFFKKINLETIFNDTNASDYSAIQTGSITVFWCQNGWIDVTPEQAVPALVEYYSRIRYIDN